MTQKEYDNIMEGILIRHAEIMELLKRAEWKDDSFVTVTNLVTQSHKNEAEYINMIHNRDLKNEIDIPKFMKEEES